MSLRNLAFFIAVFGILGFSSQACAGAVLMWDWNYSTIDPGPGPYTSSYLGSGTFTTTTTTTYEVVGITGTINGETISGLIAPRGYEGNDNLLAEPPRQVTVEGVSFVTSVGTDYNIFLDYPNYEAQSQDSASNDGYDDDGNFSATIEAVPEPSQYGFFVVLIVAGFMGWRRLSRILC